MHVIALVVQWAYRILFPICIIKERDDSHSQNERHHQVDGNRDGDKAYKLEDEEKIDVGSSLQMSVAGVNNTKYTNVKKVKLNKKSTSLGVGKTFKLQATLELEDKKKKMISSDDAKVRYLSTNAKVATVDENGKIKAIGKGECYGPAKNTPTQA